MSRLPAGVALVLLASQASADLHVVIVEGLGGEDRYTEQFADQTDRLEAAALGLTAAANVTVFRSGDYGRDAVVEHFAALAETLDGDDRLALFLVGHGSFDDHEYKFNIAGPDLTGADLAELLDAVPTGGQLVVNTGSASGATFERLNADGRTLLLATRSGVERHATRFGHYFTLALADGSADVDKNRIVTAEEAFRFAERQVADYYERNGQLATEHPRMEGDPAARFSVARLDAPRAARSDPELDRMVEERDRLNAAIDDLRQRRTVMTDDEYQQRLLEQMLELATLEEQIEARQSEVDGER